MAEPSPSLSLPSEASDAIPLEAGPDSDEKLKLICQGAEGVRWYLRMRENSRTNAVVACSVRLRACSKASLLYLRSGFQRNTDTQS